MALDVGVPWDKLQGGWFRKAWRCYSWASLRGLGQLAVLKRATYLALVFVPILAGLWPTVQSAVEQWNHLIIRAADRLKSAADELLRFLVARSARRD